MILKTHLEAFELDKFVFREKFKAMCTNVFHQYKNRKSTKTNRNYIKKSEKKIKEIDFLIL